MNQARTSTDGMLKLSRLHDKVRSSAFSRYLLNPDPAIARPFFQMCFAQRENIRRQREERKPVMEAPEFIDASLSDKAKEFAGKVTARLEAGAAAAGCEVCEIDSRVIGRLPGNEHTPQEISIVFGLVKDGKISPVAMSHEYVLTQGGNGYAQACRYDESTDFGALFRDMLAPASFM